MSKKKEKLICNGCNTEQDKNRGFYNTQNPLYSSTNKLPLCKSCLKSQIDYEDIKTVHRLLKQMDIVFHKEYWQRAVDFKGDTFGRYMTMINSLPQFEGLTWEDSVFSLNDESKVTEQESSDQNNIDSINLTVLKEKYGHGYPDNEYILFEKKFQQLRPSFQLPTTMHEEYLREYCVNKIKETIAKTKGNFKEAKEWSTMAKESAEAGKLKPAQMSKADLSQGLDGFGQLARMVEEHREIQQLLPKFTKRPKDDVDITLWLYINYIRDIKSLPEVHYEDIWKFYEERYADYSSQSLDLGENDE